MIMNIKQTNKNNTTKALWMLSFFIVSPSIYQSEFHIDFTTGVLSVVKSLDREEIITVILGIKVIMSISHLHLLSKSDIIMTN